MALKRNFSVKREAIYQMLASTETHPTAEWVYEKLKSVIPNLSLGTVYRNLSIFKEMGLAKSVGVIDGHERFDANMSKHSHFVCNKCFKVIDIPTDRNLLENNIYSYVEGKCNVSVENHNITFYGICYDCQKSNI